jgi:hypothetical protein
MAMVGEHVTIAKCWCSLMFKTIERSASSQTPKVRTVIHCVLTALINIIKLHHASSKVNKNGDGLICITEEEEVTKSASSRLMDYLQLCVEDYF